MCYTDCVLSSRSPHFDVIAVGVFARGDKGENYEWSEWQDLNLQLVGKKYHALPIKLHPDMHRRLISGTNA